MAECIFCKIAEGRVESQTVYEDEQVKAFYDLNPQAPVHVLIIPKEHLTNALELTAERTALAGHLVVVASRLAQQLGIAESGFRLVLNCNEHGGQAVDHLHFHLLGGRQMNWPPG